MPLILNGDGPVAGTLAMPPTWSELFAEVPALLGAWTSSGLADGPVSSWAASHGSAVLSQATESRRPVAEVLSGSRAVRFGLTKLLGVSAGLGAGAELTLGIRAYLEDVALDAQGLFGQSSSWRGRFRSNGGSGSFDMETNAAAARRPMTNPGWYNILVVQRAAGLDLTVNDGPPISNTTSVFTSTALSIGAASSASDTGNWGGLISRVALARSALTGAPLDTFKSWLES